MAEAALLAVHPKRPVGTHPLAAVRAPEPRLTQTAPVDVVAAGAVGTVTHTLTLLSVAAHWTLLVTPAWQTLLG